MSLPKSTIVVATREEPRSEGGEEGVRRQTRKGGRNKGKRGGRKEADRGGREGGRGGEWSEVEWRGDGSVGDRIKATRELWREREQHAVCVFSYRE